MRHVSLPRHLAVLVCAFVLGFAGAVWSAEPAVGDPGAILVEIFLAPDRKTDLDAIKKEFAAVGVTKVRQKFFQLGNPPTNLAIGRNVQAPIARLAIRLAQTYNRGITLLLPEERLAFDYVAFGTSIFDESFQIPVSADDLARLADPSLTTEQFHALYRQLADIDRPRYR
jgi:hypothetical protein